MPTSTGPTVWLSAHINAHGRCFTRTDVHRCSSRCDSGLTEKVELEENESQAKVNLLLLLLCWFYSKVIVFVRLQFVLEITSH